MYALSEVQVSMSEEKHIIDEELVRDSVPAEFGTNYGVYWNTRMQCYYVYRDVSYRYDPVRKRSVPRRLPLGRIKDGVFRYSRSYLSNKQIQELARENHKLRIRELDMSDTRPIVNPDYRTIPVDMNNTLSHEKRFNTLHDVEQIVSVILLAAFAGYTSAVSVAMFSRRHVDLLANIFTDYPAQPFTAEDIEIAMTESPTADFNLLLLYCGRQIFNAPQHTPVEFPVRPLDDITRSLEELRHSLGARFGRAPWHPEDGYYLANRVLLTKLVHKSLVGVQKALLERDGNKLAINTLQAMSNDPMGAIDTIGIGVGRTPFIRIGQ